MNHFFSRNSLINSLGWKTNRKILVIESDDWGSIRTPSNVALNNLRSEGIPVDRCNYMLNDALENAADLTRLFETLEKFKDKNGHPALITANTIVANPNFDKIENRDFKQYFYEPFTSSYSKYQSQSDAFSTLKEGIERKLFWPQLHGREHVNVSRWMRDLKNGVPETKLAFDHKFSGISSHVAKAKRGSYQAAFDGGDRETSYDKSEILNDAVSLFKSIFNFYPKSFIAPNYIWDDNIEHAAAKQGIQFFQGTRTQKLPKDFGDKLKTQKHYLGQKNQLGQRYLIRNASFEPSLNPNHDEVSTCVSSITNAFLWKVPAIVSTHRVNYIGSLNPLNAEDGLKKLSELLKTIIQKWPEVEFMTSDQLGNLIENKV
ncbi:hypothetical protein [Pararhodonellum marinum]|uniref:hypothetical protein n=1 Tax=Pararhodonellum marinum TaxID=2755358 RepID=UPI00188E0EF1|nr:hypothetical protein [Pararhodonellum marinum]